MRAGLLSAAIVAAAIALIGLTWGFTAISMYIDRNEAGARAEADAANLARVISWQLTRQLRSIDMNVQALAAEWRKDPVKFDAAGWQRRLALPDDALPSFSILDAHGIVLSSVKRDMLGADMSGVDWFQVPHSLPQGGLYIGRAAERRSRDRWEISVARRIDGEDGAFAGVVSVSYDVKTITSLFTTVDLGRRALVALLGGDGSIRAMISPSRLAPGEDVGLSDMYRHAVKIGDAGWAGPSAPDGVDRIHAFRRLGDRDLTIVVGLDRAGVLIASQARTGNARIFGLGITGMVLVIAILLIREVDASSRREERLAHDRLVVEEAYSALEIAKASADEKRSHLEATLAGMSDGVMMLDDEFRLIEWNERFGLFSGLPLHMLRRGMGFEEILRIQALAGEFGAVDIEAEVQRRIQGLRNGLSVGVFERLRPNGQTMELRRTALNGGGFVTMYSDITGRKQIEEAQADARRLAEEAAEQKSRFVATVSHEIRTPLNAVVNSLGLLDRSALSPAQHRLADTAREAGDALLDLFDDILELSKAEAGVLALRPSVFDPRQMLRGVHDMFVADAINREIALVLDIHDDVPGLIRSDCGRLRQVAMNFVSNATKFSLPGTVTIRAKILGEQAASWLYLGVSDQGPRISDAEVGQLFLPFSRLTNARSNGTPGTGLGLAICERLSRLMGGEIGFKAAAADRGNDFGNEFWVSIPLGEAAAPSADSLADAGPRKRFRRSSVLLVEDIPANHLITATMLRRLGHRVDIAESGAEAIRMIQRQAYDLVFMDLLMPGMTGYEAARRIRALVGAERGVPIIALTANTSREDRSSCIASGMNDMIGKPLRPAEMVEVMGRVLSARRFDVASDLEHAEPGAEGGRSVGFPEASAPSAAPKLDLAALDMERIADLQRGLPPDMFASLVDECLSDITDRLPELNRAVAARDSVSVEETAHTLAGMCGTYGFAGLERRTRKMMAAAQRHDFITADHECAQLAIEIGRASIAIGSFFRQRERAA